MHPLLKGTLIVIIMISTFYVLYMGVEFFRGMPEASPSQYVTAEEDWKDRPILRDMYCKALEDGFLSKGEYYKMLNKEVEINEEERNKKNEPEAERIRKEGCKPEYQLEGK